VQIDPDLRTWLSDDFDPEAMTRQLEDQAARMQEMQERLAASVITVHSADRRVSVTVNGSSAITALDIHPSAFTQLDHTQIAPLVLRTIQEAFYQAGDQIRAGLTDVIGDEEIVAESMQNWTGLTRPPEEDLARDDDAEAQRLLGHHIAP
jgi:DNA-binding protein YbaB